MLDSGRQSGFQCLTHNFQRGDCEECSFADRPVPTVARVLHCDSLRLSSTEAEGERENLVHQTPSACFMARPTWGTGRAQPSWNSQFRRGEGTTVMTREWSFKG